MFACVCLCVCAHVCVSVGECLCVCVFSQQEFKPDFSSLCVCLKAWMSCSFPDHFCLLLRCFQTYACLRGPEWIYSTCRLVVYGYAVWLRLVLRLELVLYALFRVRVSVVLCMQV